MPADEISAKVVIEGGKEAVKDLAAVGKEAKKLDGTEIKVGADTKKAERDIAGLMSKVGKLDSDAGTILLTSNATEIGNEIADLIIDLDKLDASDPTVDVKANEINALKGDLDQIETKIREVNNVPVDVDTRRATAGIDEVGKSAGSSRSALANMVGNSAQDIGEMGGVAGSTGVAIGQMAEYMSDAALEGETLTAVMANFAKVALPILAIAAAVSTVQGVMGAVKKDEEEATKITNELGDAFKDTGDWVQAGTKVLQEHTTQWENYTNRITSFGEAIDATIIGKGLSHLPVIGDHFAKVTTDVVAGLEKIGLGLDDVTESTEGNILFNRKLEDSLRDGLKTGKLTEREYKDITDAIHSYQIEVKAAKDEQAKLNLTAGKTHDVLEGIELAAHPLEHFSDLWEQLFRAISSGSDEAAASIANTLASLLHIADPAQVLTIAVGELDKRHHDTTQHIVDDYEKWQQKQDEQLQKQEEQNQKLKEMRIAALNANDALNEIAGTFEQMGIRGDALSAIFDLKDAPLTAQGEVRDIAIAIGGLSDAAKGVDVGAALAGSVKADKFLDAIDAIRPDIQQKVVEAFAGGGPDAAVRMANSYIDRVTKELGGRFTREQVARMLGLDDITATVKVAMDHSSIETAKRELAVLASLPETDPTFVASMKLALDAGSITGDQARALIQPRLRDQAVTVPANLAVPETAGVVASANAALASGKPVTVQTAANPKGAAADVKDFTKQPAGTATLDSQADTTGASSDLDDAANPTHARIAPIYAQPLDLMAAEIAFNRVAAPRIAKIYVQYILPGEHDAGGTVGEGGGIVAEKGPEIVNGRYLVTSPTIVPGGTRVTSRRRTARILRTRGHRGLKRYDAGGTVVAGPQTLNVNVNATMVGNRFELARAVDKGTRDIRRLRGTRA